MRRLSEISLEHFFLSPRYSLGEVGFFFGAGTSKEAGFPLTWELTRDVLMLLNQEEIKTIEDVLKDSCFELDAKNGSPDIECINDLLAKRRIETESKSLSVLEEKIKAKLIDSLLSIEDPDLEHHKLFMDALKTRSNGKRCKVWLYSTNYDLLFETAASEHEIVLENGFVGSCRRFFDPSVFDTEKGRISGGKFKPFNTITVNLLKIHGSLDWHDYDGKVVQSTSDDRNKKHIILPNRKKVLDTLEKPYNSLMTLASKTIGSKTKYLVCSGYSFRDEHINDILLLPQLRESSIKIIALFDRLPEKIEHITAHRGFNYITAEEAKIDGVMYVGKSNLWKFSEFTKFLKSNIS